MTSFRRLFAGIDRPTRCPVPAELTPLPEVPAPACFELDDYGPRPVCGADKLAAFHSDADLSLLKDDGRPRVVFRDQRAAFADTVFVLDRPSVRLTRQGHVQFDAPVSRRLVVDVTCPDSILVTLDPPPITPAPLIAEEEEDLPWVLPLGSD